MASLDPRNAIASPLLWLLVGPNGGGKTTYHERYIRPRLALPFVNADLIARAEWGANAARHAYDAAKQAAETRAALFAAQKSFVTETVFSHASKLDLLREAREAGYLIWITCVYLDSADLAVARVAQRVREGGHAVPEDKIRERYNRLLDNVLAAIPLADRLALIDNSYKGLAYRDVLRFEGGELAWVNPSKKGLPAWAGDFVARASA